MQNIFDVAWLGPSISNKQVDLETLVRGVKPVPNLHLELLDEPLLLELVAPVLFVAVLALARLRPPFRSFLRSIVSRRTDGTDR